MTNGNEIVSVDQKTGEIVETNQRLVFGTQDAEGIIAKATSVANRLADIVEKGKLYNAIQGKKFVRAEGWTAMAAMLGVFPSTDYCRRIEREGEIVYEAKVILRHLSGAEVGSGEAICSSKERNWGNRDEYAIKSMAQTRAVGKACRLSFSWIMAMAGYESTNAEEMIDAKPTISMPKAKPAPESRIDPVPGDREVPGEPAPAPEAVETVTKVFGGKVVGKPVTDKQRALIFAKCKAANIPEVTLKAFLRREFNTDHTSELKREDMDRVLEWIDTFASLDA